MSTTISKLLLKGEQFIPLTAAEAVMVNGDDLKGFDLSGITTLDKVLEKIRLLVGSNAVNIDDLEKAVTLLQTNYSLITPGDGIEINRVALDDGSTRLVISTKEATAASTVFVVATELPEPSEDYSTKIYLIPKSSTADSLNICDEYVCVKSNLDVWVWELLGSISIEESIQSSISALENRISILETSEVTAVLIYKSDGVTAVTVDYDIPTTLYD